MKRHVEVPKQIKEAFQNKLTECVLIAQKKSGKPIPMFPLVFSQMGRAGGVCVTDMLEGSKVKINPDYFKNPVDYKEQLEDTLPHEVAHAVVDFLYPPFLHNLRFKRPVAPHGREWRMVMNWFGIRNPRVRHKMDMTHVAVRKTERPFKYACGCNNPHFLTSNLHKRIQVKGKQRTCRRCRQRIVFVGAQPGKVVHLEVEQVKVVVVPFKPMPPATHKLVPRFIDGMLQNVRVPLTPEEMGV